MRSARRRARAERAPERRGVRDRPEVCDNRPVPPRRGADRAEAAEATRMRRVGQARTTGHSSLSRRAGSPDAARMRRDGPAAHVACVTGRPGPSYHQEV